MCAAPTALGQCWGLMPQPCRAVQFGSRPYGPQSPNRFLGKYFQDGPAELQIPRLRSESVTFLVRQSE